MELVTFERLSTVCKGAPDVSTISAHKFKRFAQAAHQVMPELSNIKNINFLDDYFFETLPQKLELPREHTIDNYRQSYILLVYQDMLTEVHSKNLTREYKVDIPAWNYLETAFRYYGPLGTVHFSKFGGQYDENHCISDGEFKPENNPHNHCLRRNDPKLLVHGKFHTYEDILDLGDYHSMRLALDHNIKLLSLLHWSQKNGQLHFTTDPLYYAALCFNAKLSIEWLDKYKPFTSIIWDFFGKFLPL